MQQGEKEEESISRMRRRRMRVKYKMGRIRRNGGNMLGRGMRETRRTNKIGREERM
jgi:hypothetical protein